MDDQIKITQVSPVLIQAQDRALLDVQVVTAKQYPRDIVKARNNAIAIATYDKEAASTCGYALPRGGKVIQGPSVHLAKIIAQNWGNLRVEAKIVDITSTQIVSHATCFDLETNYAVKIEVRRSIIDRYGKRFKEDMITVTGNAANAISYRNAVFSVIPKQITDAIYKETKNLLTRDSGDEAKLAQRRKAVLKGFKDSYGVTPEEIFKVIGVKSEADINKDQIVVLIGLAQAIKDGDTTVDQVFNRASQTKKTGEERKNSLKKKKSPGTQSKINLP